MKKKIFSDIKTSNQGPNVLIVGDSNFLGGYLAELLLLRGCQVLMIGELSREEKENLKKCFVNPAFTFFGHDLKSCLKKIEILDYIFCLETDYYPIEVLLALAKKTDAKLLLAGLKKSVEKQIIRVSQKEEINTRIVQLAFVYGPRMDLEAQNEVARLIKQTVEGETLRIFGSGSTRVYPTFVSDVIYGLSRVMFSPGSEGKIFSLISPEGITLLDFVQIIEEKSQRLLRIEFVSEKEKGEEFFSAEQITEGQSDSGWQPKVDFREGLEQTLVFFSQSKKQKKKKKRIKKKETSCQRGRKILVALFLFLVIVTAPLFSLLSNSFWGGRNLQLAQAALFEVDFKQAIRKAQSAQRSFDRANKRIKQLTFVFDFFGLERISQRLGKILEVGSKIAGSVTHAGLAAESAADLGRIILCDETDGIEEALSKVKTEIDFAYDKLSLAEAEVKTEEKLLPVDISFSEIRQLLLKAKGVIEVAPELIGVGGKRVYLVLLQNNMELRPTGGFIGSYALVTLDDGRLVDFEVEDVYTADGQLEGHVEPPRELKESLGEASWYLRDSNWEPDFPVSALRAEWFFEKETGRKVDGVIGINLFLVQNILEEMGEIELPDFQEKIDHRNLFERAEYHSETGFFPGSTQKKDFLASLTGSLFEKIKASGEETWLLLARAVYQSANEKDILLYLHHPLAMKVVADLGWDGSLREINCQIAKAACLVDYLMIVEANVGVNKTNYFVKRNLTHQVEITSKGVVKEKLQLRYENQSQSENFPAGRYKNYLRLLLPQGTKLENVKLDGQVLEEEKINQSEIDRKDSFGFLVEVPIREERLVEVNYQLKEKINLAETNQYLFLLQKQPGIRDDIFHFWLTLPEEVKFFNPKPEAVQSLNSLLFEPGFNQDVVFEVGLTP